MYLHHKIVLNSFSILLASASFFLYRLILLDALLLTCTSYSFPGLKKFNGIDMHCWCFCDRYGVKGIAYLQDRSGQVLYILDQAGPQWVNGSLTRRDDVLTVTCPQGSQKYHLLDHIMVC